MKRKKGQDAIVELAVDYAVKDVADFVIRVEDWIGQDSVRTVWQKPKH
jgi:hypothetical protein